MPVRSPVIVQILRMGLQLVAVLLVLGAAWELRTAWKWTIAPALGIGEEPQRADGEVLISRPVGSRNRSGPRGERRSNAIETSVRFTDADGRLRVVHSLGFFRAPDRGTRVPVAYRPGLPEGQTRASPNAPLAAEGVALFFDVLYGRSLAYLALLATVLVLLGGIHFFRAPMEGAAEALEGSTATPVLPRPLEDFSGPDARARSERAEQDRARGAEMVETLKQGVGSRQADDRDDPDAPR